MLGLETSHASWELKGLLLLPGKISFWRGGALPREGPGLDCLFPLHFHGLGVGWPARQAVAVGREFCQLLSHLPGDHPRNELRIFRDLGLTSGRTSWQGQLLDGVRENEESSLIYI